MINSEERVFLREYIQGIIFFLTGLRIGVHRGVQILGAAGICRHMRGSWSYFDCRKSEGEREGCLEAKE